jgi:hypothetical protein
MQETVKGVEDEPIADPRRRAERVADILAARGLLVSIWEHGPLVALSHERPLEFLGDWHDMTTSEVAGMSPRQIADRIYGAEVAAAVAWRKRDANVPAV